MKKVLSTILVFCLIIAQVIIPGKVQAYDYSAYVASTLGSYYKFTFEKDEIYNYSFGEEATYKNNTFFPLHAQSNIGGSVGYKQVTDSVTGEKYSTLQIVNGAMVNFTPLTKDGQPYELTPGNKYRVKINMFNPVSNSWVHAFLCVGQENPCWSNFIEVGDGIYNYSNYPYAGGNSFSNQGGMPWHYLVKDGTYGKTTTFASFNGGACLHTLDKSYGVTCSHSKRTWGSPYISAEREISLPVEHFEYNEENLSFSSKRTVYTGNGSNYTPTDTTLKVNNYLTLYLGGGNVSTYAKNSGVSLYGNASYSDLYDENGNAKENYTVWQIESIEVFETAMGIVNYHVGGETVSLTGEIGTEINLNPTNIPNDKYVIAWYYDSAYRKPVTTAPVFTKNASVDLYAKLGSYTNEYYSLKGANQPTLKPFEYYANGEYKSVTLNQEVWAYREYTDEGVVLGKAPKGNAYKFDPNKATDGATHNQVGSLNDYVAMTSNVPVGEQTIGGWGAASNYILRDENGNPAIAKPNTTYAVAVTYKKLSEGSQSISIGIGRRAEMVSEGAKEKSVNAYHRYASAYHSVSDVEVSGEYETKTFFVKVGEFSEGDVPVISIHNYATGFVVERVAADQNGVKSYVCKKDGLTYYPYKIISYPQIVITEAKIKEFKSGESVVAYNTYEKGKGFTVTLKSGVIGEPLDATSIVDTNWYGSKYADAQSYKVYPANGGEYFDASYYLTNGNALNSENPIFGDGITLSSSNVTVGEKEYPALKYSSKEKVVLSDNQVYKIDNVTDGRTYKLSFALRADQLNSDFTVNVATASNSGSVVGRNVAATYTVNKGSVGAGRWTTVTCYFTPDTLGEVINPREYGHDYTFRENNNSLYLIFTQRSAGQNTVYLRDFKLEDLGVAITYGGTSALTSDAAQTAKQQAIRYYFSYPTTDGSSITIGSETFKVVERGFIYRNGTTAKGDTEPKGFFATNGGVWKKSTTGRFARCWAYNEEEKVMTFSTYVKDFAINGDQRKVQVKAYMVIEDLKGVRHYIYSESVNRTVETASQKLENGRRLVWSDEFDQSSISEVETFTQKYDTMSTSDSSLTLSTSEQNYFIDSKTGEMVLRITSDGNRNYTTAKSVTTRGIMAYKYGYLEIRAKVPYQKCVWPSFWMQPDKSDWNKTEYTGEIDIFEVMGKDTKATANLHKWYGGGSCTSGAGSTHYLDGYNNPTYTFSSAALAREYHTYGFEWNQEYMAFYIDGQVYCKIDITEETGDYCKNGHPGMDCFHNYYYVCFNNWVFTDQHDWVGAANRVENVEDFGTVDYRIDYIRLYQNKDEGIYVY